MKYPIEDTGAAASNFAGRTYPVESIEGEGNYNRAYVEGKYAACEGPQMNTDGQLAAGISCKVTKDESEETELFNIEH